MSNLFNKLKKVEDQSILGWFILSFTFLPFFLLCYYSVPLGDDFWYAESFRSNGMLETQMSWYKEWSGRYMATFLISTLNPLSYGYLDLGFLHPLVLILGTIFSFRFLLNIVVDFFMLNINNFFALSILLFFYFNYLPDVGETFYWMAGAYTYQIPVIFLLLYIGLIIRLFKAVSLWEKIRDLMLALLCLFIILGCNEVLVVYVGALNFLLVAYSIFIHKKNRAAFVAIFVFSIALSLFMILAEGNFARATLFVEPSFHVLKALLNSLARGIFVLFFWIPSLLFLLLCIFKVTDDRSSFIVIPAKYSGKKILLFTLVLLILVVLIGFFPSIYSTNWIPQRAYTPIFVVFMVVFISIFVTFANRFPVLISLNERLSNSSKSTLVLIPIIIVTLSANSNVMNAYVDLTSGKASCYHMQVMNTYNLMKHSGSKEVSVQELIKRPLILPIRWPQKHNKLANGQWQEYFHLDKVELE